MKIPNFQPIKESEVVTSIEIKDLVLAGLSVNEDFEISKDFHYTHKVNGYEIFDLHIVRSEGWYSNLEIHFGFCFEVIDRDENIHISQEVAITQDDKKQFCFICPLLGDQEVCTKLYLRSDFPLFASRKALKVE